MRRCLISLAIVVSAAAVFAGAVGANAMGGAAAASLSHQRGALVLAGVPGVDAANPKTHTLYVPLQCSNPSNCGPSTALHVMDIVDTSKCTTRTVSGCRVVGQAQGGKGPTDAVIDEKTDTVYVMDGTGAVSVVDGGRCNATVRTHCGVLATIKTGGFDVAGALNSRTHTLYVATPAGDIFVINVASCNAQKTAGCRQSVKKVTDPRGPDGLGVDLATNTVYVADGGLNAPGNTVSVINGAACNGSTGSGCGRKPRTIPVGGAPFWVTVDQAANTVYVPNALDGTVSVINGAACNATTTSGCHRKPPAVATGAAGTPGADPSFTAIDESLHTLFVINQTDDTLSEINITTCNGHTQSGCPARARNEHVPFNPAHGENPGAFALVSQTGTAYMVNVGGAKFLAAYSVKRCNAMTTAGCRVEAPSVRSAVAFPVLDPTTDTIYAGKANGPGILVINGAGCTATKPSGCAPVATIPFAHPQANLGSIDQATHTLYAADTFSDTVSAIDITHCNAHDTSGCSAPAPKVTVGPYPSLPVLNSATHTLYVPIARNTSQGPAFDRIAVVDAATCNAHTSSGCGQTPAVISVGENIFVIGLSMSTDTVYAPVLGSNGLNNSVWVINGAICNASTHSGCGSAVVAKATVGLGPRFVLVDDATHTVYVDNNADGDYPGTVSIINGATCNGTTTASCAARKPTVGVGRSPTGMAIDPRADRVYVDDYGAAAVSVIDGSHCNAAVTTGCGKPVPERAVGSAPGFSLVDHKSQTVLTTVNSGGVGRLSIFPTLP